MTDLTREQLEELLDSPLKDTKLAYSDEGYGVIYIAPTENEDSAVCVPVRDKNMGWHKANPDVYMALVDRFNAAPNLARQLLATMAERDEAQAAQAIAAQCCICGKKGLSTAEDGGPECELHDGRWVCGRKCWEVASDLADPTGVKLLAELRAERDRMNQWRETAIVERDTYSQERDEALAKLAEAQKREAGLIASLTEVKEELLWNAFHAGHEQSGFWDHCCMSDGEWLVRECGFDIAQRVYSAQSIRDRIPEAAKRAALSAAPTGEESNG